MPIKVALQTIDGKRLDEAVPQAGLLNQLLPFGDTSFPFLGCIDPYGDTLFNGTQMLLFLQEWEELREQVSSKDDVKFWDRVRGMAERCKSEPHIFLRFIGD